jgi:tetratricopeptide (TPR) repeat protein
MIEGNADTERVEEMRSHGPKKGFGSVILIGLLFMGCAGPGGLTEPILDTPEHHVYSGFRLIKKARHDDARREFKQALRLRPDYSPAYRGMALAYGMEGDLKKGFRIMEQARQCGENEEQVALAYVGMMRLHVMERGEGWLDSVKKNFAQANVLAADLPDAHYAMGLAYSRAYRLDEARGSFHRVMEINRSMTGEAREQLALIEMIEAADPTSSEGRRLAFVNSVTRAQTARLLVHELPLNLIDTGELLKRNRHGPRKVPAQGEGSVPADVLDHAMREDIERILALDIRGLQPFKDGSFGPDECITRAAFAMVMADMVMTIKKDPALAARYIGSASPFEDVEKHAAYFTAVMVCKNHGGIMDGKSRLFHPMGTLSGAQALLAIRKLKEECHL